MKSAMASVGRKSGVDQNMGIEERGPLNDSKSRQKEAGRKRNANRHGRLLIDAVNHSSALILLPFRAGEGFRLARQPVSLKQVGLIAVDSLRPS